MRRFKLERGVATPATEEERAELGRENRGRGLKGPGGTKLPETVGVERSASDRPATV